MPTADARASFISPPASNVSTSFGVIGFSTSTIAMPCAPAATYAYVRAT